jgi:hypothetical protein
MAIVNVNPANTWVNQHLNVSQAYDRLYDVFNPDVDGDPDFMTDLRPTISALEGIIGDAIDDGKRLRALGGGWSLSTAAVTDGRLINTKNLNWRFPLGAGGVSPGYPGDPSLLMYMQAGMSVAGANIALFEQTRQQALKTTGASNGQTMVGAFSTGTHGSRFQFGSMQDFVVALHIITGPGRVLWLERASYPVMADHIVAGVGAQLIRDDTIFNSALVSFGSFGVVYGIVIETEPLYLLEEERHRLPLNAPLRQAMRTLDFSGIPTPHPGEVPLHFELVVDPHNPAGGAYVTTMYRRPYRTDYDPPTVSASGIGPGDDLLAVIGQLGDVIGLLVAPLVNTLVTTQYSEFGPGTPKPAQFGMLGEIFSATLSHQKEMSAEIGVALGDAERALDLMLALPQVTDYPGLVSFRYVKKSKALLAFTKFDTTCAIELPAAYADGTTAFYEAVWQGLENAGIPFTLHWGQVNNFTPARVRAMYGSAVDDWIKSRNSVLDPQARAVFNSPFLQSCGLG